MARMTRIPLLALALALVLAPALADGEATSFEGKYQWKDGGSDWLKAEFTPTGEGQWDVSFQFKWNGSDYSWTGELEGSLEDGGNLSGTARSGATSIPNPQGRFGRVPSLTNRRT